MILRLVYGDYEDLQTLQGLVENSVQTVSILSSSSDAALLPQSGPKTDLHHSFDKVAALFVACAKCKCPQIE